jgi:hypothetical protein
LLLKAFKSEFKKQKKFTMVSFPQKGEMKHFLQLLDRSSNAYLQTLDIPMYKKKKVKKKNFCG